MPCNDVSEWVEIRLGASDQLEDFSVRKQTCGAPVGGAELLPHVRGRSPEQLMSGILGDVVPDVQDTKLSQQFMLAKQLYALQAAMRVYTGAHPGTQDDAFALSSVEHGTDTTVLTGRLRVDLATEEIRACAGCGTCGRRKNS